MSSATLTEPTEPSRLASAPSAPAPPPPKDGLRGDSPQYRFEVRLGIDYRPQSGRLASGQNARTPIDWDHSWMSEMVAVTSTSQVLNARVVDRKNMAPMLKRAAVLCDRVLLDTSTAGPLGGDFERLAINSAFGGAAEGIDLMAERQFRKLLLRMEDLSDRPAEILTAIRDGDRDPLLEEVATDYVLTLPDADIAPFTRSVADYKARGSLRLELLDDLRRPLALRGWLPNPIGILGPMHQDVLRTALRDAHSPLDTLHELVPTAMFDVGALSWREVLRLRTSAHLHDFRRTIQDLEGASPEEVSRRWRQDLEEIAVFTKPSLAKTLVSGFLGNLPFGELNPLGVGQSIMDYFRADELTRRFGWVYFVLDARQRSGPERALEPN